MFIGSHTVHILHWTDRWETDFIDKPMKRWLQIATDDVDAHQVIGGGRRARCCNVKHRPPSCAMRINGCCCCWTGCYGWTRPRTQLREDPRTTPVSATGHLAPMEGTDMDVDAELMQKFSCMGTTDKDVLISEFQRLLGFQLNPAGCAFFLDMTNWWVRGLEGPLWGGQEYDANLAL